MTDRSIAQEEKRRLLLAAAVRVFARKGYHTCRVGDIAEEAGVAHGLLYHYFGSKDELLGTIFRETWRELVDAIAAVEQSEEPAPEQLRQVAAIVLRSWRREPELVRVLVSESARSPELSRNAAELGRAIGAIARIVAQGQAEGSLRADLDPRLAAWIFYGGLEELLTGWVLGQLPDGEDEVARAERTIVELVCGGLVVAAEPVEA